MSAAMSSAVALHCALVDAVRTVEWIWAFPCVIVVIAKSRQILPPLTSRSLVLAGGLTHVVKLRRHNQTLVEASLCWYYQTVK
jgi:hypothetical protein